MDVTQAYRVVVENLLEVAMKRGDETLKGKRKEELSGMAEKIVANGSVVDWLVDAVEDFMDEYGDEY